MLLLAFIIISRRRTAEYVLYFCLSALLSFYVLMEFLTLTLPQGWALFALRTGAAATNAIVFVLLLFSLKYTKRKLNYRLLVPAILPLVFFVTISYTSLLIKNVEIKSHGFSTQVGVLYNLQSLILASYLIASVLVLVTGIGKLKGNKKASLQLLVLAFVIPIVANLLTNTLFIEYARVQFIGPLSLVMFTGVVAYAIVKHRLFDIRLIVARSLGYAASIAVLAASYGFIAFGIARFVFGLHISVWAQVFLSAATGVAGLAFQYLRKIFDRITNKVFYRDAYDPQQLFDELNRTLVSSISLEYILKHASRLLADNLKSSYVMIVVREADAGNYRIVSSSAQNIDHDNLNKINDIFRKLRQSIVVLDAIDDKNEEIKSILVQANADIVVALTSSAREAKGGLGYIIVGPKKSGNPYSNQDIRVFDTTANELVIAIQNALHFEEIQRFNVTLQAKIDEATRKLRSTNQKLEALDETKDDFISMASHQLRTPLTSVKGYLSMVLEGDAGKVNDTQRKMLSQAFISSQRMVYLIADLLNVSRLKTGKFVIDSTPVDLSKVISEEISQLVETADSRGIKLTYKKPADFPVLNMDETKTRQVIMNFIDNAIYYTPSGGKIDVQLIDKAATIELRIVDDGIGVPKSEQHHLFTKFYRARNAQKARPDGTGLGLFMAKKVIVAQGGAIIFESREGQGSTFGFSFSKQRLAVPLAPSAPAVAPTKKTVKA